MFSCNFDDGGAVLRFTCRRWVKVLEAEFEAETEEEALSQFEKMAGPNKAFMGTVEFGRIMNTVDEKGGKG